MTPPLHKPLAVFDAGLGSYAAVRLLHDTYPEQDILYLADRASFPYGGKSKADLVAVVGKAVAYLETFDPCAVVLASNAPTVVAFDVLKDMARKPLFGVYPPVADALVRSRSKQVAVLGVRSMVESSEIRTFIDRAAQGQGGVHAFDASDLVALIENAAFLNEKPGTQGKVSRFVDKVRAAFPDIDVMTLSSTHLPWLSDFFEKAAPDVTFLDPAATVVAALEPYVTTGSGRVEGHVTEDERYPYEAFAQILDTLDIRIPLHRVAF
ncbi:glutamate racemase [Microvirga alba]|uniref:Aspartate/glutamate racemase family protein n=1 Tax=Microvirga alba TaxID=2791025 RepID=A0A931FRZ0_9HYPH|nr:aspartate/glutamate racemase family protein [Microvirga alba]MBF9235058.1 aspartate/glutamate racemase family protein [Microvirga alba]